jgi:serine/threonine protein phosphatase PrpC
MGDSVRVRDPKLPQELGLTFDEARAEVKGTPTVSGEYAFNLQWSSDGSSWHTGECLLFVNPDPRSLWKCLEPSQDEPYQKSHTDSAIVTAPTYKIVAASRRGRSHEHSGTFRDDDFYLAHDSNSNWSVMIVADGAGSAKSSRWGSKLAVHAFGEYLQFELAGDVGQKFSAALAAGWSTDDQSTGEIGSMFHKLFLHAGKLALKAIEVEAQKKGAQLKDYSTTLLAAVMRQDEGKLFLSTFWIGDGAIAVYGPRGKVRLMGTPDGGEYAGQTRFLDWAALEDKGSAKRVGIGRFPNIKGLLLMTDGVSDPRFETDTGLADASLWDSLWDEIDPLLKSENPDAAMVDWLHFFTSGHHDDRTIAVLCVAEPTP